MTAQPIHTKPLFPAWLDAVLDDTRTTPAGTARGAGAGDTVEIWTASSPLFAGRATASAAPVSAAPAQTSVQAQFANYPMLASHDPVAFAGKLYETATQHAARGNHKHAKAYMEYAVAHLNELKAQGNDKAWHAAVQEVIDAFPAPTPKGAYRPAANGWNIGSAKSFLDAVAKHGSTETKALVADKLFNHAYPKPSVLQTRHSQSMKFSGYNDAILRLVSDPAVLDEIHQSDKATTAGILQLASQEGRLNGIVKSAAQYHAGKITEAIRYHDAVVGGPDPQRARIEAKLYAQIEHDHTRRFGQLVGFAEKAIIRKHSQPSATQAMDAVASMIVGKLVGAAFKFDKTGLGTKMVTGIINKYMKTRGTDPKKAAAALENAVTEAVKVQYFREMYPNKDPSLTHSNEYQRVNQRFQSVMSNFRTHVRDGRGYF